jgi:hypothetical protein
MKKTIDFEDFRTAFVRFGRGGQFTALALRLIFEHIESMEQDLGEQFELDIIATCCEYTEYATSSDLVDAFEHLGIADMDFEDAVEAIERRAIVLRPDSKSSEGPFVVNS